MLEGFLKIDGIEGECKDVLHKRWIDVSGFSWSVSNEVVPAPNGSFTGGTPEVQAVSFTQPYSRASVGLFMACANGRQIPEMVFESLIRDGDSRPAILKAIFRDCIVMKVATSSAEANVTERIEIAFRSVLVESEGREG
jgi:type VI secretion system secreted protein Hcp